MGLAADGGSAGATGMGHAAPGRERGAGGGEHSGGGNSVQGAGEGAGGGGGLLDLYPGASAGYSLRQIGSGPVVRLRRASDSAESDFGASDLTGGTAAAWASSGDAFVAKLYDQGGSGNDAVQSTAASQPKLITAGVVELEGGLPAMVFDGVDDSLGCATLSGAAVTDQFFVFATSDTGFYTPDNRISQGASFAGYLALDGSGSTTDTGGEYTGGSLRVNAASQTPSTRDDVHTLFATGSQILRTDSGWDTSNWTGFVWGGYTSQEFGGRLQEWIIYPSDQSANRTGIETNINDHYGIY